MTFAQTTLEAKLDQLLRRAEESMRQARVVTRQLKSTQADLVHGNIRAFRRDIKALMEETSHLHKAVDELHSEDDLDAADYLSSGQYANELRFAAASAGLSITAQDDRLLCYPSVVRVRPAELRIDIDGIREHRLRPSEVVAELAERQERGSRFRPDRFLDSLRGAYELLVAQRVRPEDAVIRLVDIWAVLTLLPDHAREYGKQEFVRDLYLLDRSGLTSTRRSNRRMRLCASSGTRATGVLTIVTQEGAEQQYWGISFTSAADTSASAEESTETI